MKKDKNSDHGIKEILADSRFAHIVSDPRYRNISSKKIKVHIDKRFKSKLTNEKFTVNSTLDPRGKPKSYGTKAELHKFYNLESDSEDEEKENDSESNKTDENGLIESAQKLTKKQSKKKKKVNDKKKISERENTRKETDRAQEFMASLLNPEKDLARGDTFYSDDSSDDDSSTTDEEEKAEELKEFEWGEMDGDAKWDADGNDVEETNRFAVCDMDWDNVKAVDLLVLFSSFAPSGGVVKKVIVYPSEFGKARMAEEDQKGPQELVRLATLYKKKHNDEFSDLEKLKNGTLEESDNVTSLELEALRRYQRNRLRYYYAVVECDSIETATAIYKECDRTHYEVVGVTLDLRYIPSEMEFDEIPHDVCEKIPDSYEFENLQVASLNQAKPTLTWEETTRRRKKVLKTVMTKALKKQNYSDDALNDFIGGSDTDDQVEESEDDGDGGGRETKEERISKFRALISEVNKKERRKRDVDMEDIFAEEHDKRDESDNESDDEENDESEDDTKKTDNELTPFENMLMRKKQKRKERKLKVKKLKEKMNESENENGLEENENNLEEEVKSKKKRKKINKKLKGKKMETNQESTDKDLALLVMDEEEEEKKHFDMRKIHEQKEKMEKKKKRKRKNKKEKDEQENIDKFQVDVSDPRFSALYSHGGFNVDPSHPKYDKHSSLNQNIIQKQKKIKIDLGEPQQQVINKSNIDSDISDMIRRIRMKTSKLK